jgi:hypothetical protein
MRNVSAGNANCAPIPEAYSSTCCSNTGASVNVACTITRASAMPNVIASPTRTCISRSKWRANTAEMVAPVRIPRMIGRNNRK